MNQRQDGPESAGQGGIGRPPGGRMMRPSRRAVLKTGLVAGVAAGAGSLAGIRGAAAAAGTGTLRAAGSLPYPHLPVGTDTIPQIEHIVVLMMENHSYDNRLGLLGRPGADGLALGRDGKPTATNPYPNGDIQHAFRMPTTCQEGSHPSQTWAASHTAYDNGRNDGFVRASGAVAMGYWQRADTPFYYSLASVFPIADRYFASVLGQTFPNRRYLMSATSLGMVNDVPDPDDLVEYPANGTIFDKLNAHGISWKDYWSTTPSTLLYPFMFIKHPGDLAKNVPIHYFFDDAKAGKLPGFCLVEPNYGTGSEEDPQNIARGEAFAAKVIDAVMTGPKWNSTLLIWTYDEHGGYYDHVPPPAAVPPDNVAPEVPSGSRFDGFGRYGFRVPCAVVSPWARPNYVSHTVFDHTSILKLAETKWNLPALTRRDANANNMLDMLDFRAPAFARPPALAKPLLDTSKTVLACDTSGPGTIPPPGSVTKP